jgi:hypothetical protein
VQQRLAAPPGAFGDNHDVSPIRPRVDEATFIDVILSDERRAMLLAYLGGSAPHARSIAELISVVAKKCRATPDELRRALRVLATDQGAEAEEVLGELLFHPEIPEDALVQFAEEGRFISALGHRAGPRRLLEVLAERHRYPEAITTLALHHYGAEDESPESFRTFLQRYEDVHMLEYNLVRARGLSEKKRRIVREIFGDD